MRPDIRLSTDHAEFDTAERCAIQEIANTPDDPNVSIARARVAPGVATAWHRLDGTDERYLIVAGEGLVAIEGEPPTAVAAGDVVLIPAGCAQRISNIGGADLVFYAICSPRFLPECYIALE